MGTRSDQRTAQKLLYFLRGPGAAQQTALKHLSVAFWTHFGHICPIFQFFVANFGFYRRPFGNPERWTNRAKTTILFARSRRRSTDCTGACFGSFWDTFWTHPRNFSDHRNEFGMLLASTWKPGKRSTNRAKTSILSARFRRSWENKRRSQIEVLPIFSFGASPW